MIFFFRNVDFEIIRKKWKKVNWKMRFWIRQKSAQLSIVSEILRCCRALDQNWRAAGQRWSRVEVPEVISAEQCCFIVLTFFSADSENMKNISADQLCFRADQLWFSLNQRCSELKNSALFQSWTALFQREIALNQRCSALIFLALKHWIFSAEQRWTALIQRWFTLNQLWYLHM